MLCSRLTSLHGEHPREWLSEVAFCTPEGWVSLLSPFQPFRVECRFVVDDIVVTPRLFSPGNEHGSNSNDEWDPE